MKWIGWTSLAVFILLLGGAGYVYYTIKSAKLSDIVERQQGKENTTEDAPSIIKGTIDKASRIAGKPVDAQDALDAASILLNSGLSFREISYLTGQSETKMSVEEKQEIRDLLLEKLSEDEISALRSITTKYGKNLVILNPDYPIELVGVSDPKEREKIKKELAEKGQNVAEPVSGTPNEDEEAPASAEPAGTDEQTKQKTEILAKYQDRLTALHNSCKAKVDRLTDEVIEAIDQANRENKPLTPKVIDEKLQNKIIEAETACDGSFQEIVDQAKKELADEKLKGQKELAAWKKQYEKKKSEARTNAFNRIMNHS
ncbi:hypothetical protein [Paenibacillus thermotolerans]|uniref:hypothetical protein n=1 Tax=Paenibacillus thermotolerans TaxID=3027807 RepID=UPI002367A238|nr:MULTISPECIES: hypothetical protein [unclassified Paenibacillus]